MPQLNFGNASDLSTLISMGARGIDTGLMYDILPMSTDGAPFGHFQESVGHAWTASGVPREEFFITNSVPCCPRATFPDGESPTYDVGPLTNCPTRASNITGNVLYNLAKLKTDYVDLLMLMWPCDTAENTVAQYKMLEPFVAAGKARAIGVGNMNASFLKYLLPRVSIPPAVNQAGHSIAGHYVTERGAGNDDDTVNFCKANGIQYQAYSPLGNIAFAQVKRTAARHAQNVKQTDLPPTSGTGLVLGHPSVVRIAAKYKRSAAQVALKWLTQQDIIFVTGEHKISHAVDDTRIFDKDFELTEEEMAELTAIKLD